MLHWLIVIPYYFFGALVLAGALAVSCRLLRLPVTMERIATVSVFGSIAALAIALGSGAVGIERLTIVPVLLLGLVSFVVAGFDAVVMRGRPLLHEGDAGRRRTADPQVL